MDYRQGLGTALVKTFLQRAAHDRAVTICLWTNSLASWEFYEKRGFVKIAEKPFSDGSGERSFVYAYVIKGGAL